MIPTGTPASTNHDASASGELNSQGNQNEPTRVHSPAIAAPLPRLLKLSFPPDRAGTLTFAPANDHI